MKPTIIRGSVSMLKYSPLSLERYVKLSQWLFCEFSCCPDNKWTGGYWGLTNYVPGSYLAERKDIDIESRLHVMNSTS